MINSFLLQQGVKPVLITFILSILSLIFICVPLGIILLVLSGSLLFIYRNKERNNAISSAIVAPIDGKIVAIDRVNNQDIVYVDVSLCDVHVLRAPKSGAFFVTQLRRGLNLDAHAYKAKSLNEKCVISFDDMSITLLSGKCNPKIAIASKGEVDQHEPLTTFLHGLVMITLPVDAKRKVNIGQKISASETILV